MFIYRHLVPDLTALKESANDLQKENQELQKQVGKLRYQEVKGEKSFMIFIFLICIWMLK